VNPVVGHWIHAHSTIRESTFIFRSHFGRVDARGSCGSSLFALRARVRKFGAEKGNKSSEGAAAGGAVGGVLGALIAGLTATGSISAIAATGGAAAPLVVGPLAAALAGLGAGAVGGGIIGALVGAGIPEVHAKEYVQKIRDGAIMVSVNASLGDAVRARQILSAAETDKSETKAREKLLEDAS